VGFTKKIIRSRFEISNHVIEFSKKQGDGPELCIAIFFGQEGRISAAELVVED
jgi:hypothetical protein